MADIRVAIVPWFNHPDKADGGIRRVVEAQIRHLPEFGIRAVENVEDADVIATHGTASVTRPGVPVVNHNHGLYWSRYDWPAWAHETNALVVQAMSVAVAHTAPSDWVCNAIRRGMLCYPEVVYHGVDPDDWGPAKDWQPFVLWNKARTDLVSDPADMNQIANRMGNRWFVSTFGSSAKNVKIVGKMPYPDMKRLVSEAGVYLATVRETFGIGTLEAMACGVPVAGWDWGGQSEIVSQGVTGYLAPVGDYDALANAIERCLAERDRLSANCIEDVRLNWTWRPRIEQYARIYQEVAANWRALQAQPKVSVVVTCYNLARYLGDALRSIQRQDLQDWECIIVDDCSTDQSRSVAKLYTADDERIRYVKTPKNLGLSLARNFGFRNARGRYIINLDADDMLADNALSVLSGELDSLPGLHVVSGHLDIVNAEGQERHRNDWPGKQFDWLAQMAHMNQIHYCSMMRREVMERSGGFRERDWRAEDASFWSRISSLGFRIAKVTEAPTLIYRDRGDSKSKGEPGDGPWTAWFPWSLSTKFDRALLPAVKSGQHPHPALVPFGAQGRPSQGRRAWLVEDHTEPDISVVIPVGPGHEPYVIDALESCVAQTYPYWEVIVVNDTGKEWGTGFDSPLCGAPYAKVVTTAGATGPTNARNEGAKRARGYHLLFLDADDWMLPAALESMMEVSIGSGNGLVYTDIYEWFGHKEEMKVYQTWDFECGKVLTRMQHTMQCLIPRWAHERIGGFDTSAPGWEDWDYLIGLQSVGVCSYRLAEPLFVYRKTTGTIRERSWDNRDSIVKWIHAKWIDYYKGRKSMACSGCPKGSRSALPKRKTVSGLPASATQMGATGTSFVMLAYQGPGPKRVPLRGPVTHVIYQFKQGEFRYVDRADALEFMGRVGKDGTPHFIERRPVAPPVPKPADSAAGRPMLRPIFPSMPDEFAHVDEISKPAEPEVTPATASDPLAPAPAAGTGVAAMNVSQVTRAAKIVSPQMLMSWLQEEREGKNRKGVVKALQEAIDRAAAKAG